MGRRSVDYPTGVRSDSELSHVGACLRSVVQIYIDLADEGSPEGDQVYRQPRNVVGDAFKLADQDIIFA